MNLDVSSVWLLARKEMMDSRRNRWFLLYALIFAGLSLGLSWIGLSGIGGYGVSGFGRTTASLINLILLIVPLMGLTLGAMSLAGERERGSLLYILSQPVSQLEVLTGKFMGLGIALFSALVIGFGLSGVLLAVHGGTTQAGNYLILIGLTLLLALASLSLGLLISSALRKASTAVGISLFVWLFLVFLGDLGLMGSALATRMDITQLFAISLINPLQVFKIGAVLAIRGNLEVFGPAGIYAVRTFGSNLIPLLLAILLLWIFLSFGATYFLFKKKGVL